MTCVWVLETRNEKGEWYPIATSLLEEDVQRWKVLLPDARVVAYTREAA